MISDKLIPLKHCRKLVQYMSFLKELLIIILNLNCNLFIQEKKRIIEKLKIDKSETDVFKSEVIQELKSQIRKEEQKLHQVSTKPNVFTKLKAAKISFFTFNNKTKQYVFAQFLSLEPAQAELFFILFL